MAYMTSKGFEVVAVSADGPEVDEVVSNEGVKHVVVPFSRRITPLRDLYCLFLLIKLIIKEQPQIIHSHTPKAGLLGMIAAWVCGIPVRFHTVAGMPLVEYNGALKRLLIWMERLTYACATHVLPNSKSMSAYIQEVIYPYPSKIRVIGNGSSNGIDLNYFKRSDDVNTQSIQLQTQLGITQENFVWLFVGRLVGDKGIHELIEAFVTIHSQYNHHHLILVGPFEDDRDCVNPSTKDIMTNHQNIHVVGYQDDVRPWMCFADVFVFPSYREGFPNVLLQALAMGIPCIATDIIGCNEIIEHGKNGYLVPPKSVKSLTQAMELFSNDTMRIDKEGENVYRQSVALKYDRIQIWEEIFSLYKSQLEVGNANYASKLNVI